ncbi:hypothetical protein [Mycobacterium sp. 236(2023)]|uniref:hypothetical protein n=1 Tax=Mycobacterium sp. 236(2023) TaxID=3038163 RepID=UPI0024154A34|nr:hypothetical protein [Mycobacterium sp. 236(2023)]MDG4668218.1 hypothetical protein [Mycobacterium sp. 236(2023)]
MGRTAAVIWHASFSIAAGVLYFLFVLPRTLELLGDTSHTLGTVLRIVAGALIGLAALPVVFTLLRTRRPEFGTPQLALNLRTASIALHVLAGVVIIGAAISEIWLSLDTAGQWLFGAYGAAGAVALLGVFAFYLAFVAELPPPPPKPLKVKERSERRGRKDAAVHEAADEPEEAAEAVEVEESSAVEVTTEADEAPATEDTDSGAEDGVKAESDETEPQAADGSSDGKLQNRRPTGKGSVLGRRRKTRGGVAVED